MRAATWSTATILCAAGCLFTTNAVAQAAPPAVQPAEAPAATAQPEAPRETASSAPAPATGDAAAAPTAAAEPVTPAQQTPETAATNTADADTASPQPTPASVATDAESGAGSAGEDKHQNPGKQSTPEDAPATLFDSFGGKPSGGFGGVGVMYTRIAQQDAAAVCGEGAFVFDHALTIGGGGCGIASEVDGDEFGPDTLVGDRVEFGYGGLIVRYHFFSKAVANLSLGTLIGAGGAAISNMRLADGGEHERVHAQGVFVVEPQLGAHLNLTRWLRFGATVGYRAVAGVVIENMSNSDLSGIVAGGAFHIGRF